MSTKKIKPLKRHCPECDSSLALVRHTEKDDGVSYSASYEECEECGYQKEVKNKHNHIDKTQLEL